jgi:hypothetical protein
LAGEFAAAGRGVASRFVRLSIMGRKNMLPGLGRRHVVAGPSWLSSGAAGS